MVGEGRPFYFDDFVVGDEHPAASHTPSKEEIIEFAKSWDPQPWHIDEVLAKQSMFGGLTACSAHIFSIFNICSQQWQSGVVQQALAGLGFDEMRMLKPVYADKIVHCSSIVDEVRLSKSRPDAGIVSCTGCLINQRGDVVFSIKSASLMARGPAKL